MTGAYTGCSYKSYTGNKLVTANDEKLDFICINNSLSTCYLFVYPMCSLFLKIGYQFNLLVNLLMRVTNFFILVMVALSRINALGR